MNSSIEINEVIENLIALQADLDQVTIRQLANSLSVTVAQLEPTLRQLSSQRVVRLVAIGSPPGSWSCPVESIDDCIRGEKELFGIIELR